MTSHHHMPLPPANKTAPPTRMTTSPTVCHITTICIKKGLRDVDISWAKGTFFLYHIHFTNEYFRYLYLFTMTTMGYQGGDEGCQNERHKRCPGMSLGPSGMFFKISLSFFTNFLFFTTMTAPLFGNPAPSPPRHCLPSLLPPSLPLSLYTTMMPALITPVILLFISTTAMPLVI